MNQHSRGGFPTHYESEMSSFLKSRIIKTTHKYGIKMATSVDHAYEIDKGNGNTLWCDAIKKEMTNDKIQASILPLVAVLLQVTIGKQTMCGG